jgi:putative transposase
VKLTYDHGRYYLCFHYKTEKTVKTPKESAVIALDPGVRTFQTGFNNRGGFCKIGDQAIQQILACGMYMDKLQSKVSQLYKTKYESEKDRVHHKNLRRKLKRKTEHCQHRLQNRIRDAHWKIAHYLCSEYDEILIPR